MKPKRMMALLVSILAVAASGCSDGRPLRVPVSGQVLIDGQPLKYGYIEFVPTGARPSGGRLDENGRFSLSCFGTDDGAVTGTHRVAIKAGEHRGENSIFWHAPKKYNDIKTSGLTEEINGPTDSLVITLSWEGQHTFLEIHQDAERLRPPRSNN